MAMNFAYIAKVKSKFGEWAVVEDKKIVSVAFLQEKAISACNERNGHSCDDCAHPQRCTALR